MNRTLRRKLLVSAGFLFFGLGAVGLALPVMPTTIFWIIAAACFTKGSPAMRDRIYGYPTIGPVVEDFVEHGRIRRRAKVGAIIGVVITFAITAALLVTSSPKTVAGTAVILLGVCAYIATRPEPHETPTTS